jgi:hypothetical protein
MAEKPTGLAQILQTMTEGVIEAINASNQAMMASNQQLVAAITAPKVITAPDGRQYTSQTAAN